MRFKPIIVSHHMLMGLKEGQEKMSKSDPESAIFMEDTAADVRPDRLYIGLLSLSIYLSCLMCVDFCDTRVGQAQNQEGVLPP
jgi:hypothetical protein